MAGARAPKQWSLTKNESITSFESWKENLQYTLSLDPNFATFLVADFTWGKKTNAAPLRGLTDDGEGTPNRRTAAQKVAHLDLMLGQIANFCPVISRNSIVKNSTSINHIWQAIRLHFGFQSSGAHFLDLNSVHLEPGERPEDLFQRINSFVEDNLLKATGNITHHGEAPAEDEELSPTLENFIVLSWLRLIHPDLPALVKQRYCTELRSKTLASIKPEISQALDSLLDEISTSNDAKVLRSGAFQKSTRKNMNSKSNPKSCILCKQAKRPYNHFLSKCIYLPEDDRRFMTKIRQIRDDTEPLLSENDNDSENENECAPSASRRVCTKRSPMLKTFYKHFPLHLTLDTGAEVSMMKSSIANYIGAKIQKTNQTALQADGVTPLDILGETHLTISRGDHNLQLHALVVNDLDVDVLAGIPFMDQNDIAIRPAKHQIVIEGTTKIFYNTSRAASDTHNVRRAQAFVLRGLPTQTVLWPGEFIEVPTPCELDQDCILAVEPRVENHKSSDSWLSPHISESVGGRIRILNDTEEAKVISKNEHFCQVRLTTELPHQNDLQDFKPVKSALSESKNHIDVIKLDPDNILTHSERKKFQDAICEYEEVFDPNFKGYNGTFGKFQANVNMGPVQPPQRKGRMPQYSTDKLKDLQEKFDELERKGVFKKPEEVGVSVEYLNPSFLIKKQSGGFRLVTAFSDVGRYSKPQPSLMPDVDSILRRVGQWKYIIVSDLTNAFYQIPLSQLSMKYCGVATPFKGVRVYTSCAMGMPGSETALEELMCRVLGDQLQEGFVAKLADNLYCGGNTPTELLNNWLIVLENLKKSGLKLSPSKTVICPTSTNILGWIWSNGELSASPHRISVLSTCNRPESVHALRSFIGAYKVLSRVLQNCSQIIAPLEDATAGQQSKDKISWTDELLEHFDKAKKFLTSTRTITLPRPSDQLWIVTDGSVSKRGIGATLYVTRNNNLRLAGFFSAKLRKHQITWLPCEIEALCIAASVKHFSPFIIQSKSNACVITDSQPCVQAVEKLCRGEFSASPRVTSFLSTVSRYQVQVRHISGSENLLSDFASRNAPECEEPRCQICSFIKQMEESVVRAVKPTDLSTIQKLPFTTRSTWLKIQSDCPDLRRTHAHLRQGTRPSKKLTNIKDVKRYLHVASVAKDGLLIVKHHDPLSLTKELIIVPRSVLDGLTTALHIKLDHPSKHQLELVMKRHFYALDMRKIIENVCDSCYVCTSLKKVPHCLVPQSSESPPEAIGLSFAADVMRRNRQVILVLRETVTSYTAACIIEDEKRDTLRDNLVRLVLGLQPLDGPPAIIRVDPAPGFTSLASDTLLQKFRLCIEIGRIKNPNKNPVAEKAIAELQDEILRHIPGNSHVVSHLDLAIAVARLNSRIRYSGLSARELWTQRSQFTNEQLPLSDRDNITKQQDLRQANHEYSEASKANGSYEQPVKKLCVGDLVYLYSDRDKTQARNRYLVVSVDGEWCQIKKFVGNQLRANSYKVKLSECFKVPTILSHNSTMNDFTIGTSDLRGETDNNIDQYLSGNPSVAVPALNAVPTVCDAHVSPTSGVPPSEPDDHESSSYIQDIPDTPDEIVGSSRPQRNRKPPKYLDDYVT